MIMMIPCGTNSFVWVWAALLGVWFIFMGAFFLSSKFQSVAIIMMISYRKRCQPTHFNLLPVFFFFLAALGLCCCAWAFSSCSKWGLLLVAVHGLLIVVASLVAEHGLQHADFSSCSTQAQQLQHMGPRACGLQQLRLVGSVVVACGLSSCGSRALEHRLSSCGAWAQLLRSMWNLPGPGIEPLSPTLAGRFSTTVPPGKSHYHFT